MSSKTARVVKPKSASSKPKLTDFDLFRVADLEESSEEDETKEIHPSVAEYIYNLHRSRVDDILPQNRWNMDETAFQRQSSYITSYECVSAAGVVLPPLVVFKKEVIGDDWMGENVPEVKEGKYKFVFNRDRKLKGKKLLEMWFHEVFLPNTVPEDTNQWRLLVWDDDKGHVGAGSELGRLCEKHKVRFLDVSADISHFALPLEAIITPIIKDHLSKVYKETQVDEDQGEGYAHKWLKMIHAARRAAFDPQQVTQAWQETGCFPPDREIIKKSAQDKGVKERVKWVVGRRF